MTEVFRQRNAQRIVGSSILLLLVIAAVTILMLLHKNEFFTESKLYYVQADQSQLRGLRKSMNVRILGEPVGTVTDISYVGSTNEVRLTMKVKVHEDDTKNVIWENSQVVVARSFGIGEPYLEIERGVDLLGAIVSNMLDPEANAIRIAGANARGVKIQRLVEGSPAMAAGLAPGDIILSFNGLPVNNLGELYDYMSRVAQGSNVLVGIHGREYPIAITASMVEPKRLEAGGTIIQFQPEPDRLEELTDKLSRVQESIANVEVSMVDTLGETNKNMANSMVPALNQFLETSKSVENTSDQIRQDTLERVKESLAKIDQSTRTFNERLERIENTFSGMVAQHANPAFDRFGSASERFNEASVALKTTSETIASETTVAMKDLQRASESMNLVLNQSREVMDVLQSEVNQLPGTAAKINQAATGANQVLDRANVAIGGANDVIDGAKEHWLLRRAVKRSQDKKAGTNRSGPIRRLFGR